MWRERERESERQIEREKEREKERSITRKSKDTQIRSRTRGHIHKIMRSAAGR